MLELICKAFLACCRMSFGANVKIYFGIFIINNYFCRQIYHLL